MSDMKSGTRIGCFAILVIWSNGERGYLREGLGPEVARFRTLARARSQRKFMLEGMADEVQSINVVRYPKGRKSPR